MDGGGSDTERYYQIYLRFSAGDDSYVGPAFLDSCLVLNSQPIYGFCRGRHSPIDTVWY